MKKTTIWIKNHREDMLFAMIMSVAVFFSYRYLPDVYFMHDEWRAHADVFLHKVPYWVGDFPLARVLFGRIRLLGTLTNYLLLNLYPFQSKPFILLFYILHIANSFLFFFLLKKISRQIMFSILAALLFSVSSTAQQAVSWIGAGIQILGSMFFLLLSLILSVKFSESKKNYFFLLSFFILYIAYLFKETAIIGFPFIICVFLISRYSAKAIVAFLRKYWIFLVAATALCIIASLHILVIAPQGILHNEFIITPASFINMLYYPLVSLSQSFIPFRFIYRIGAIFLKINYPVIARYNDAPTIIHFIITDLISILFSVSFILAGYFILQRNKYKGILLVSVLWYIISFVPISLSLIHRNASYIDSRHMYEPMIGASCFFAIFIISLVNKAGAVKRYGRYFAYLIFIITALYLIKEISITQREVKETAISGIQMTKFIRALKNAENSREIPNKPVYYFSSDRNYYYEGNKLPFLLGAGFVLSVIEYPSGRIPQEVLQNESFIGFGSQGYVEAGDKGYGYYYDMQSLKNDRKSGKFTLEQVIGFSYNSQTKKMSDITDNVRKEIINTQ